MKKESKGTKASAQPPQKTPAEDPTILTREIRKTGFVLENQTAQTLKSAGWTVISNRYYVDQDVAQTVREMDLVAYRCSRVQHFDVYTALIISCKKNDECIWAMLARDINLKDPNADWWPLHAWSNDRALAFQLSESGKSRRYHEDVLRLGVEDAMHLPDMEVFAFQLMSKASGVPRNDRDIYSSFTNLMKAQAYEISALPQRRQGTPVIYQFNLINVVDAELVRLVFSGDDILCEQRTAEQYLARYIINRRETFARIRIIKADKFAKELADYSRLHQANCNWISAECDKFYSEVVRDPARYKLFADDFRSVAGRVLYWALPKDVREAKTTPASLAPNISWDDRAKHLTIWVIAEPDEIDYMNESEDVLSKMAKVLKDLYRYEGPFVFDEDIPF